MSFRVLLVMCTSFLLSTSSASISMAQPFENRKLGQEDKFRQLEEILPTPNGYRTAAGNLAQTIGSNKPTM